jgi:hypothetical protein
MTEVGRRSRWWAGFEEPGVVPGPIADPWPVDGDDVRLSEDQVRFLESLADQPRVPRLAEGLPGVGDPGIDSADETGD